MKSTPDTTTMKQSRASALNSSPTRQAAKSDAGAPTQPRGNNAAVPITIYRELVAELQHTQQRLREVSDRNEQLAEHNQKLRHEIEQVVQAALNVRTVANDLQPDAPILPQVNVQQAHSLHDALSHLGTENQRMGESADQQPLNHASSSIEEPVKADAKPEWAVRNIAQQSTPAQISPPTAPLADTTGDVQAKTAPQLDDHMAAAAIARQLPKSQVPDPQKPVITAIGNDGSQHAVSIETLDGTVTLKLPTPNQPLTTGQQSHATSNSIDRSSKRLSLGGWWLTVIVIAVVVSAFSAGFVAMLFLQGQRSVDSN
ncbi:MAG: hypothetical protein AAFR31_19220 [Cyanobacteria bacterium J06627_8]